MSGKAHNMHSDSSAQDQDRERDLLQILQTSRNKLKAVFDAIDDPIISFTPDLTTESLNMAAARSMGMHPRELVGKTLDDIAGFTNLPEEARVDLIGLLVEATRKGSTICRQFYYELPDSEVYYEITVTPVLEDGDPVSLLIVHLRDITEIKQMERKIREYNKQLEADVAERTRDLVKAHRELQEEKEALDQANHELRRLEKLRRDLMDMVVHDMKGPLAEIMGNLDLLSYGSLDEIQQEARELAYLGGEDLLRMIMNLLDIARLEEGALTIVPTERPFGEMAASVRDKFRTMIRLKGLDVRVEDRLDGQVSVDNDVFARVLQNLLTNALEHTPEGGRITMAAGPDPETGGTVISVRDTGCGIPDRFKHRLFQKFTQATEGVAHRTSTGLGLAFCKMAVEAHRGRIWFESREGQGTEFFIALPPWEGSTSPEPAAPWRQAP